MAAAMAGTPQEDMPDDAEAQHRYKMLHMKKMVLTQIARIQHTDQPEEVKKAEIQGVYQRFKSALHGDTKASSLLAAHRGLLRHPTEEKKEEEVEVKEAPAEVQEETAKTHRKDMAEAMKHFGHEVSQFKHTGMAGKARKPAHHKGASLRRLAEDAASHEPETRRRRSPRSANPLRTSFARPT